MAHTKIVSIGTAVPEHVLDQAKAWEFAHRHMNGALQKNRAEAVYRASGIHKRYSVLADYGARTEDYSFYPKNERLTPFPTTLQRMDRYQLEAPELSKKAIDRCLGGVSFPAEDITHLITVSCTGMYAPGLDIDLISRLNLNRRVTRYNISFMGCYAAITALRMADSICQSNPAATVLVVSTEICTLHFQQAKDEEEHLSNALFGDGSAAVLLQSSCSKNPFFSILGSHQKVNPGGSGHMSWHVGNEGFLMHLSSYVPDLVKEDITVFVHELLEISKTKSFNQIAIHPGGKKIVENVGQQLGLSQEKLKPSLDILKEYGNMSSPTILFVLEQLLKESSAREEHICALAFGPGLTFESMMLRYDRME